VIRTEPEPRAVWGKVIELWTFTSELGVPDSADRNRFSYSGRKTYDVSNRATEHLRNASCSFQQPEEIHR